MQVYPLTNQEAAANDGYNFIVRITADDLTQATNNTLQTLTVVPLVAGDDVRAVRAYVKTAFQNTADAAFNSDTVSIGDNSSVTTFTAANEVNFNGTVVVEWTGPSSPVAPYTAANNIKVTFNSMTGKALKNLNKGELEVFCKVLRIQNLAAAAQALPILTK